MKSYLKFLESIGSGSHAVFANTSGDKFWGDLGCGALIFSKFTKRFLISYRSKYVNEGNVWGIIGGRIDKNEDILPALKREIFEESGYDDEIKFISLYIYKTKGFKYHNFIGVIDNEFIPKLDWENSSYLWVTFDELLEITPKHFGLDRLLQDEESLEKIQNCIKSEF